MRKTLAALGFLSTLLIGAQANATIVIQGPGVNTDPALPFLPPTSPTTETFDSVLTPVGTSGTFTTPFATFSGTGVVVNGSVPNVYAAPFMGPLPGAQDTTNYLATTGTETITFTGLHNVFALFWGSIDTFNHITFYNGTTQVATFGGL